MPQTDNWLENLKAGDRVFIRHGYGANASVATVDKVTDTQIVIGQSRFRRDNGKRRGDSGCDRSFLRPITDEGCRESCLRDRAYKVLRSLEGKTSKMTADECSAIIKALSPFVKQETTDA